MFIERLNLYLHLQYHKKTCTDRYLVLNYIESNQSKPVKKRKILEWDETEAEEAEGADVKISEQQTAEFEVTQAENGTDSKQNLHQSETETKKDENSDYEGSGRIGDDGNEKILYGNSRRFREKQVNSGRLGFFSSPGEYF